MAQRVAHGLEGALCYFKCRTGDYKKGAGSLSLSLSLFLECLAESLGDVEIIS